MSAKNHKLYSGVPPLLGCWLLLVTMSSLASQSLTLEWDPSPDPGISGYNIYYGTASHGYDHTVSSGKATRAVIAELAEGTTYFFAVTAYDDDDQESDFSNEKTYAVPAKPSLPLSRTLAAGQNVTFGITAVGTGPLKYQWKFNSASIESATNAALTLDEVTAAQAGTYYAMVSNAEGLTNMIAVNLAVNATVAATLTQAGLAGRQYSFNVSGVTGGSYVVQASSNLVNWVSIQTNAAPFKFVDSQAGQFKQRFYRAMYQDDLTGSSTVSATVNATATATLTQASYANGQCSFNVSGMSGYSYVVQASTNLVDWLSIDTNAAPFKFIDSQASQFKQRFYRTVCLGNSNSSITVSSTAYATTAANLTPAGYANGEYSFKVSGVPSLAYVVQASTNLMNWDSIETNTAPFTFTDTQASQFKQRFYRTFKQ